MDHIPRFIPNSSVFETPEWANYPELDYTSPSGNPIKAIFYNGLEYEGQPTRVFAYMGFPAEASLANPVPAVVLVHGGGGTAFAEWVDIWVNRGYAAFAIDTEGKIPLLPGSHEHAHDDSGLAGAPGDGTFASIDQALEQQWMYHAVSKVMLANSLLRSNEAIDANKIGLAGISWGGLISSITIGHDNRFAFAVLIYGCGYLHESYARFKTIIMSGPIAALWDPSNYLMNTKLPTLWLNSDHDAFFSAEASSRSAAAAGGSLTLLPDLVHGHVEGWAPTEIYQFADSIVKGGAGLIRIIGQPVISAGSLNKEISFAVSVPFGLQLSDAYACYAESDLAYSFDENENFSLITEWLQVSAAIDQESSLVSVTIPAAARICYVNIAGSDGTETYTSSTNVYEFKESKSKLE